MFTILNSSAFRNKILRTINNKFSRYASTAEKFTGPVIGIDLGTTNSCVAVMEGQEPRVIVNSEGARTTPSVVAFTEGGEIIVGETAKRQAVSNSKNTVYGTKRLIGRRFNDPEVQAERKTLPFDLVESKNGDCWVRARGKDYSPSQIGSYVLNKMRETASSYLGKDVKNVVVTVPAYFNDSQRQATKDAGSIAGLNVVRIINEPTAAALSYGLNKKEMNKTIAVYDLGGGTFDISVLEINDGVFEVKSTNGDTRLGGEDFDNVIIKYLVGLINKELKDDVTRDLKALQRIKEAAEKLKIELSFSTESEVNLPYILGANSYSTKIKRAQLEGLVDGLINKTIKPCETAMKDAGLTVDKLDEVILVGGMTRMPKVQAIVKQFFKREPSRNVNPDEAVAIGAAVQGGVLVGSVSDIVLVDVTPYSLGVKTLGDIFSIMVPKNTPIPTKKSQTYTTSEDNQTGVSVSVFQGERSMCQHNLHLGEFQLGPIPPRPRNCSRIEVSFEIDSNGIVKVTAMDVESNAKANTTLKSNPRGLSKVELEKMAQEAEKEREKDAQLKAVAEARNEAESILHDCKKFINERGSEISATDIDSFKEKVNNFEKKALSSTQEDATLIQRATHDIINELTNVRKIADRKAEDAKKSEESKTPGDESKQEEEPKKE